MKCDRLSAQGIYRQILFRTSCSIWERSLDQDWTHDRLCQTFAPPLQNGWNHRMAHPTSCVLLILSSSWWREQVEVDAIRKGKIYHAQRLTRHRSLLCVGGRSIVCYRKVGSGGPIAIWSEGFEISFLFKFDLKIIKEYGRRGLNPWPLACEASVITTRPHPQSLTSYVHSVLNYCPLLPLTSCNVGY